MADAPRLPPASQIVREALLARLRSVDSGAACGEVALSFTEFDDVRYQLSSAAAAPQLLDLSLALPCDSAGELGAAALPPGAAEAVREAFGELAPAAPQPAPGFNLTLRVDLGRLPPAGEAREAAVERLASLRALVLGAPLRALLGELAAGRPSPDALLQVAHRPGQAFFAKRSDAEAVTVVFPMRFGDAADATLARSFLAQFAEARRAPALSAAPSVAYAPAAPGELRGQPHAAPNAGYVSFVLFRRHVADERRCVARRGVSRAHARRLEAAAWALLAFPAFVSMHIKCSKAYMHSRMRRRTAGLLTLLNRAKPEPLERERKTAQGKTFRAKPAGASPGGG